MSLDCRDTRKASNAKNRSNEILAKYAIKYLRVSTLVQGEEDKSGLRAAAILPDMLFTRQLYKVLENKTKASKSI